MADTHFHADLQRPSAIAYPDWCSDTHVDAEAHTVRGPHVHTGPHTYHYPDAHELADADAIADRLERYVAPRLGSEHGRAGEHADRGQR